MIAKKKHGADKKLDGLGGLLDEAEGRVTKKPRRADPDDLDLDAAWSKS